MRVLITGGMGFIGSHLAERLSRERWEVTLFDSSSQTDWPDFNAPCFRRVAADILDLAAVRRAMKDQELVCHLAGLLGTETLLAAPRTAVETNINGTINILEAAREQKTTVLYLGLLPRWANPYMITKNAAEEFCRCFSQEYGIKTILFRAAHIYGPRQRWTPVRKAVPTFIMAAMRNEPLPIFGSGNQRMDLLYVADAVEVMVRALLKPPVQMEPIGLGSGRGTTVIELARRIIELCGSSSRIDFLPKRRGEPAEELDHPLADIQALQRLFPDFLPMDLVDGLRRTIDWYRRYAYRPS